MMEADIFYSFDAIVTQERVWLTLAKADESECQSRYLMGSLLKEERLSAEVDTNQTLYKIHDITLMMTYEDKEI